MKKKSSPKSTKPASDEMRTEYNFSNGVRGKYAKALRENGYIIRVYKTDGTVVEKRVAGENMVVLEPEVKAYFPDSKSVNQALRTLIALVPYRHKALTKRERRPRTLPSAAPTRRSKI